MVWDLKSDTKHVFMRYKALVENVFQLPLKTPYSDNGEEYDALKSYLAFEGINHLTTPPYTPQHNGLFERRHRHIVETFLTLLTHAYMPLEYWPYACSTAVYLINRLPTATLNNDSPYFKLFVVQPNYSKLKCFGCLCYPWLKHYSTHKLDPKSKPCIFIGYSPTQSAYYCLELESRRIYTSRHVHFIESDFPFMHHKQVVSMSDALVNVWAPIPLTILPQPSSSQPIISTQIPSDQSQPNTLASSPLNNNIPPSHQMTTRLKQGITKPIKKLNLNVELCHTDLPKNITQALKSPVWRQAMDNEMQALT